jgi:hypothetical protein
MKNFLSTCVARKTFVDLGTVTCSQNIQSLIGPFRMLSKYRTQYPDVVIQALCDLYCEYNTAFLPLVEKNREWNTDYQYCIEGGIPVNFGVQVDMIGLPQYFLDACVSKPLDEVRELLRTQIFEIENSLAMYQLLQELFCGSEGSFFKYRFRRSLNMLREKFSKKIALLAVTQEKYDSMRACEFGKKDGEVLTDDEVFERTGFDAFFGPEEFRAHIEQYGDSQYLLYVRSSHPVSKLRKPDLMVEHTLLDDAHMRRIIKANALTFNVDSSDMSFDRRINDTKEYMPPMDMAFSIDTDSDLFSSSFNEYLASGKLFHEFEGDMFSCAFKVYLEKQGIDPNHVASGDVCLRAKPRKESYGCYGHIVGPITKAKFRSELRRNIRHRGGYVIQPEMPVPYITNTADGAEYTYIDRVFFTCVNGQPSFVGGFRSLMPVHSIESKKQRNHGNGDTVWGEIVTI